jgi:hypothetical protein
MATTKSVTKTAPAKRAVTSAVTSVARGKPAPGAKPATKTTAAPKVAPKLAAAKPARSRAKKPPAVAAEQRRYYVEVAAYHIAERRGFAPGDPLQDWVQAEAEIDRLIAEGLLGS